MSSKIRVLSDDTINKIAAGEVIENPSSVVKELVENSLDAGATEITIEIREGGRQLIRITDNGSGMNGDDALLCLERHATSKLKAVDDIEELVTMGFRGEAIPSIASISKFTLFSRVNDDQPDQLGTMVIVDGGKIVKCCPVECSKGTTIEVKSLFFNVPVRRKFQKSPTFDAAEICRIVTLLSLANPEVKFQLISNQESVLSAPVYAKDCFQERLEDRVQQIFGLDFTRGLCPLEGRNAEYSLEGFLGLPASTKPNRTGQYLFINRRAVSSQLVSYAIREGYGTMLGTGRHPVFILHLSMPGNLLDVNVHPQKKEVRIRQEYILKDLIIRSVGDALRLGGANADSLMATSSATQFLEERQRAPNSLRFDSFPSSAFGPPDFVPDTVEIETTFMLSSPNAWPPVSEKEVFEFQESLMPQANLSQPKLFETPSAKKRVPRVVAALSRYLIALQGESDKGQSASSLCLIDQHAAHARVIFDKLQQKEGSRFEMQALLIPYIFDLVHAEAAFLKEHLLSLQQAGLPIKEFGERSFMIDALPQLFGNVDIHQLIEEIIRNLADFGNFGMIEQELQKKIAFSASRAAISGERFLGLDEAQSLVDQLFDCSISDHCPNGKPTMRMLTHQQIANLFNASFR